MTKAPADTTTPNIDRALASPQHGAGLYFTTVDVIAVADLSAQMRRITFGGEGLRPFHLPVTNTAVRLFIPKDGQRPEELAPQEDLPDAVRALRRRARVYTARRFDPETVHLDVDFVLHGHGLASGWAATAEPGDRIYLSGPRAHATPATDATHLLFCADQTALPALEAILESLPADADGVAFVSALDTAEQRPLAAPAGVDVRWIDSQRGQLVDAVAGWWDGLDRTTLGTAPAAWLAGEFFATRAVREYLTTVADYPRERVASYPYWRNGDDATTFDEARAASVLAARDRGVDASRLDSFDVD